MNQQLPLWLGLMFPFLFAGVWVLVIGIISRTGWAKYAARFAFDRPVPDRAKRFRWQSLALGRRLGGANYGNCVNIWIDDQAIYMRPSLMFRIFHPLLRLRWSDVESVSEQKRFLARVAELRMKQDVPPIMFMGRSGRAIAERWQSAAGRSRP